MGKHIHEVMGWPGPMTHRQFISWMCWLEMQWNNPDRTDHYLMQIAAEVCRGRVKRASAIKTQSMEIEFKTKNSKKENKLTKEQATVLSKQRWLGIVQSGEKGMKVVKRLIDPPDVVE